MGATAPARTAADLLAETMPPDIHILYDRELVRREGLRGYAKLAWQQVEPRVPLKWGWALDAMCDHLEAVSTGEIIRLLTNVPPGMMKSFLFSVFWPSYEWGPLGNPHLKYVTTSYASDLTTRDSRRMRDLVTSQWFQERWPTPMKRMGETSFENMAGGFRESAAFNSTTGKRGDRVIVDDPHSVDQAESNAERGRTLRTWREAIPSRVNDPILSAIIVIMQRLNVGDVSGDILRDNAATTDEFEQYVHLCLPMEFEVARRCRTYIKGELFFEDPRTTEGELLFPERFPRNVVERDKRKLGSVAVAGQFQQRPSPREGNIVKTDWFVNRFTRRGERPLRILQSWDTGSKTGRTNDPSACLTGAEFRDRIELWHFTRNKVEFPSLVQYCKDQYAVEWLPKRRATQVLIEDKDSGQQLLQTLKKDKTSKVPAKACNPGSTDKYMRLEGVTPDIEAGNVWLPADEPWVAPFLEELTQIPNTPHDESGDCLSQLLIYIRENPLRTNVPGMESVGGKESARLSNEE